MPLVSFSPFVAGTQITSSSINTAFSALFTLFGQTGGAGALDSANFVLGGINAAQINPGNMRSGNFIVNGLVTISGGLIVGASTFAPDSRIQVIATGGTSGTLLFAGINTFATLDWNKTANTFTVKPGNTAFASYLRSYIPAFTSYGSLPAAITQAGVTEASTFHAVYGTSLVSSVVDTTVNLTGAAAFSSASSYSVVVIQNGTGFSYGQVGVTQVNGTQFKVTTNLTISGTTTWIAFGY
jgi:hypothetical protein